MLGAPRLIATVAIGLVSGVLSGMFGIGGGVVTTPAIRLLLGEPALIAVGTPLVAILPSAATGAYTYYRRGLTDLGSGIRVGLWGSAAAVAGALLTPLAGGRFVLIVTAVLIGYVAVDMVILALRPDAEPAAGTATTSEWKGSMAVPPRWWQLAAVGLVGGLYSGFLGLGGGLIVVPLMTRWLRFPIKRAIATSLTAMAVLALPGIITHSVIGNIDWVIAMGLVVGVVPGSAIGARLTIAANDRVVRIGFAVLLFVVGSVLALSELVGPTP